MNIKALIAQRYLVSRKRFSMITVITGVSVCGVTLGVAALIVVLSVMNGFYDFVREMLVTIDPHVRIEASTSSDGLTNVDSLLTVLRRNPDVVGIAPVVEGKALLRGDGQRINKVVIVKGVDVEQTRTVSAVVERVDFGEFNLVREESTPGVVIGTSLARRFGLFPGGGGRAAAAVSLVSSQVLERSLSTVLGPPQLSRFDVRGLFELQSIYDESHVFIDLKEAQRLFGMGDRVTAIELRLSDIHRADHVKTVLQNELGDGLRIETWYDQQKSLYDVMKLEKWGASIILGLIVLVAAFNIVGSLTMVVIEKRQDIGILRSMGFTRKDVRQVFLLEGLFIGLLGVASGLIVGLGLALGQKYFKWVPLAESESFLIDAYPIAIRSLDVVVVVVLAVVVCMLASIYPAVRAASEQPADAVRDMG